MRKTLAITLLLSSGLMLAGCTNSANPEPTPSSTSQVKEVITETKTDIALGTIEFNSVKVDAKQVAYGQPSETQFERLTVWSEQPAEGDTSSSDKGTGEEPTSSPEENSEASKEPTSDLKKDSLVVSIQFLITNNTGNDLHLGTLGLGTGNWNVGDYELPEGGELTPDYASASLVDYSDQDTVHSRLKYETYEGGNATLANGESRNVVVDVLVPQPLVEGKSKEADLASVITYQGAYSPEQNFTLKIKE